MKHPAISFFIIVVKIFSWIFAIAGLISLVTFLTLHLKNSLDLVLGSVLLIIFLVGVIVSMRIIPELLEMLIRIDNNLEHIAKNDQKSLEKN